MDPLTQGTIGAVLPQALSKKNLGIVALLGFLSGMAPDLDILIRSSTDPLLSSRISPSIYPLFNIHSFWWANMRSISICSFQKNKSI